MRRGKSETETGDTCPVLHDLKSKLKLMMLYAEHGNKLRFCRMEFLTQSREGKALESLRLPGTARHIIPEAERVGGQV